MNIDYTINNVSCNGGDDGSISIDTITLTSGEYNIYGFNYTIDWTDNIDNEQLLNSNLIATSLSADTYGFRLFGNSTYSSWTYVNVTEPLPLTINSIIKKFEYINAKAFVIAYYFLNIQEDNKHKKNKIRDDEIQKIVEQYIDNDVTILDVVRYVRYIRSL